MNCTREPAYTYMLISRTVLKEIEEIQSGLWDNKIEAKVTGQPLADVIQQTEVRTHHL